jgi:hypothetical protein
LRAGQLPIDVAGVEDEVAIDRRRACAALCVLGAAVLMVLAPVLFALGSASWELGSFATAMAVGLAAVVGVGKSAAVVLGAARFAASSEFKASAAPID